MNDLVDTIGEAAGAAVGAVTKPLRWKLYGGLAVVALAAGAGAVMWHGRQVEGVRRAAFEAGQSDVQGRWDRAVSEAKEAQAEQNEQATDQFVTEREVVRVVYRDRIKEIKSYEPNPGTDCPTDAGFLQRYNAPASPAADAQNQ